jgi:hypothetical protein
MITAVLRGNFGMSHQRLTSLALFVEKFISVLRYLGQKRPDLRCIQRSIWIVQEPVELVELLLILHCIIVGGGNASGRTDA